MIFSKSLHIGGNIFITVFAVLMLMCSNSFAISNSYKVLPDTVHVEEVVISGSNINKYQVGAKIEKIDSKQLDLLQDGGLDQLLMRYTPISFKSTASAFSTIRVRGTSPDHTSINFGGININSMTLGHSNVGNVPLYLFDEIGIQYGSSSVENGSGSIGGAVHLGMKNYWVKGFKGEARVAIGSFGEQLYGTKLFYGNGKWEGVTRAYYYAKENNFPFYNTTYDFEKGGPYGEDVQRNAAIDNKGVIQEVNYRFSKKETLSIKGWFENDWHEIQQNMQTNFLNPDKRETHDDTHVRCWVYYDNKKHSLKYKFGGGYVYDNGVHNNSTNKISTQRLIGEAQGEYDFSKNSGVKFGTKVTSIFPEVYAYSSDLTREDWADVYLSYYHHLWNRLKVTANIRQAYVTDFEVPFTPAIGFSYKMLARSASVLKFTGNVSRSYRVPTFNDRYWIPGGNPDLESEDGVNYELGSSYSYCIGYISGTVKVSAFYLDVDNWLLWINDGGWKAENVQRVTSKGIEFQTDWNINVGKFELSSGVNYTYNPVVRAELDSNVVSTDESAIGRQLEYVPLHSGVGFISSQYENFSLGVDASYTYEQYTSQNEGIIPSYFILNANTGFKYQINAENAMRISASINNILNKDYQSSEGYPMPRRSFRISITYNFK